MDLDINRFRAAVSERLALPSIGPSEDDPEDGRMAPFYAAVYLLSLIDPVRLPAFANSPLVCASIVTNGEQTVLAAMEMAEHPLLAGWTPPDLSNLIALALMAELVERPADGRVVSTVELWAPQQGPVSAAVSVSVPAPGSPMVRLYYGTPPPGCAFASVQVISGSALAEIGRTAALNPDGPLIAPEAVIVAPIGNPSPTIH